MAGSLGFKAAALPLLGAALLVGGPALAQSPPGPKSTPVASPIPAPVAKPPAPPVEKAPAAPAKKASQAPAKKGLLTDLAGNPRIQDGTAALGWGRLVAFGVEIVLVVMPFLL
jgi:hypothetical protein